ncbi:uncharacterized protein [Nicotiana sylvestris]|uniref:uncharacterized protein n=1 Tax=Nicotiana sylvestris TaxID=4096 RepID=UPI00388CA9F2
MKDCPRLRKSAPPQTSQPQRALQSSHAMITAPVATLPTHPTICGGQGGRGRHRGGGKARYYALPTRTEAVASDYVIIGIVLVYHRDASVLFDPGSTYSYVSSYFAPHLGVSRDSLRFPINVSTHMGDSLIVDRVYRSCVVALSGFETRADLLLLNMVDFDVFLSMDWLSPHYAISDYHTKTMKLAMPGVPRVEWRDTIDHTSIRVISFIKSQRMVVKGCDAYLAYVRDVIIDTPIVDSVPIVRDFSDVFPADLPGMPPDKDINFGIDIPGVGNIMSSN